MIIKRFKACAAHTGTQTHGPLRIIPHAFVPLKRKLAATCKSSLSLLFFSGNIKSYPMGVILCLMH